MFSGVRMSWAKLLAEKAVAPLPSTKQELDNLRSIVKRSLRDAVVPGLSADARFVMAYDAARTLSWMIVRARPDIAQDRSARITIPSRRSKPPIQPSHQCRSTSIAAESSATFQNTKSPAGSSTLKPMDIRLMGIGADRLQY